MNTTKTNEFEQVDINAFIEPAEISKREEAEKAEGFKRQFFILSYFPFR